MAVVVDESHNGDKIYRSANGVDIDIYEKENADKLDQTISRSLEVLIKELAENSYFEKKEKAIIYWRLGRLTNLLLSNAELPKSECNFFFDNLKLRLPKLLSAKSRGPNRDHIKYCHRLGTYDESTALTLKWSEWVYLFDSSGINSEMRFDSWFNGILKKDARFFDRKNVRLMGRLLNNFFLKLETSDFSDDELNRCYCEAKNLCGQLKNNTAEEIKNKLTSLKKNRMIIAKIIDGRIGGQELYEII